MRSELAARAAAAPAPRRSSARAARDGEESGATPLPELETLVARLPAELRETLDDLFRARFVSVKRLPKKDFQPARIKAPAEPGEATP